MIIFERKSTVYLTSNAGNNGLLRTGMGASPAGGERKVSLRYEVVSQLRQFTLAAAWHLIEKLF
jgi:hypothetical protein